MAFKAQRNGICGTCNQPITVGQFITWRRTGRDGNSQSWHYPDCSPKPEAKPLPVPSVPETKPLPKGESTVDQTQILEALQKLQSAIITQSPAAAAPAGMTDIEVTGLIKMLAMSKADGMELKNLIEDRMTSVSNNVDQKIAASVDGIDARIKKVLNGERVKTLVIEKDEREYKKFTQSHENLPDLIKMANVRNASGHRINIYMHGPAGSGKSTAARQMADALGLKFGYSSLNPMTPDSRALGFMHAGGSYVSTEFFKCYTEGGVFCFDEIDNASASFVTTLNSALENGHGAFPHGTFPRHADFVCVCTANTIGRGGDIHYPERRALDSAFLERFAFLEWAYDQKLTKAVVGGILGAETDEFMTWVDDLASSYRSRFPELVVSPRAYIQGALLKANGFNKKFIEQAAIGRGLKNA